MTMRNQILVAITFLGLVFASSAFAEQWTTTWMSSNGQACGENVVIHITEASGVMKVHSDGNGTNVRPYDRELKLAADGSGRLETTSRQYGQLVFEVPAGKGRRPLSLKQVKGICQWAAQ